MSFGSDLPLVQPVPYDRCRQHVSAQEKEAYVEKFGIDVHLGELHFGEKLNRVLVVTVHLVGARQDASVEAVQRAHQTLERPSYKTEIVKPHINGGYVLKSYRETEHGQEHHKHRSDEHRHLKGKAIRHYDLTHSQQK